MITRHGKSSGIHSRAADSSRSSYSNGKIGRYEASLFLIAAAFSAISMYT